MNRVVYVAANDLKLGSILSLNLESAPKKQLLMSAIIC